MRRFLRHRPGVLGVCVILALILLAALAPTVAPYDWREQDILHRFASPSQQHLLGTDELGRDIFTRLLYGGRFSLTIGVASVAVSLVLGTLVGLVSGFYRRLDSLLARMVDIMMASPASSWPSPLWRR